MLSHFTLCFLAAASLCVSYDSGRCVGVEPDPNAPQWCTLTSVDSDDTNYLPTVGRFACNSGTVSYKTDKWERSDWVCLQGHESFVPPAVRDAINTIRGHYGG